MTIFSSKATKVKKTSSSLKGSCSEKPQKANLSAIGTVCLAKSSIVSYLYSTSLGYKKKDDERHKDMHSLVGTFIKSEREEILEGSTTTIYPFKIIFPMNKVRVFYCRNRDERHKWV